ncbi:MAG: error-prone DNA polymerase [Bordetella sp. SCN 67-23]|nr:error-prone DNA polymerase [Burkholderiales bacterium]ODS76655.1 MAG: error-prone DNA polymerase [Bordetella sp. SCN 67-23]OJW93777.1 MAG: error-prone DNA polymerase [Burkholderiales bacterium 67-32]
MPSPPPSRPALPGYAELQCLTNFTFLRGASWPGELVERAAELGYTALAITDECSLAGVVRAHEEAKKAPTLAADAALPPEGAVLPWGGPAAKQHKLHLILGSQFRLDAQDGIPPLNLILLATNKEGYGNLSELITYARMRAAKGSYRLLPGDLSHPEAGQDHLRGVPDCLAILAPAHGVARDVLAEQADWLARTFPGRCWMGLALLNRAGDAAHRQTVEDIARARDLPVVPLGQVEMHVRSRKPLHDTLCGIRLRQSVAECGYALAPNAEQHLRARVHLAQVYGAELMRESLRVARLCTFNLNELQYEYPEELVPAGATPTTYLRDETYAGANRRFPEGIPDKIREQLEKELALISELRYEAYFLTVYDLVRFAKSRRILCQGRGSAANSAVCFCLGITVVPPDDNSLFGRFISKERNEPPDIDIDFEHQRREEVIQYVYEKYGRRRAALTAVVISYRSRSALRDVGRALGMDLALVDRVAKAHQWWDGRKNLLSRFEECGLAADSPAAQLWARLTEQLLDFPRHLSQHPGGFVMSRGPLSRLVPIENAAMPDRSVVQWDKDDLDAVGLLKVDVLALGMLTALRRALEFASQRQQKLLDLYSIPPDDSDTYDMICQADTIGVFQIESRAQMSMLPRLQPRHLYDLTIQVAIVRPGPIQGGMVHPFLKQREQARLHGPARIPYPSPKVRKALARTFGVPIFQEQVMQIAMYAAGYSEGQADELRRSMAAWRRKGDLAQHYERIVTGMLTHGYERAFAESICRQIQGFGEYGFPESHAASFAQLAYSSSWLKRHEPEAFLAALLNSQPMGFYSPYQLIQDAQRHGVAVLPADVLASNWEATLEATGGERPAVRLGLNQVQGLPEAAGLRIQAAREHRPFADATDLGRRADLDRHALQALAAADALRRLSGHRRAALWEATDSVPQRDLLRDAMVHEQAPLLDMPNEADDIRADYEALKLTLRRHPLALLRDRLARRGFAPAEVLHTYPDRRLARACGIVTVRQRPGTAKGAVFVTLEDETGQVNVIVWPGLVERQRRELVGAPLLGVYGTWQSHQNVRHLLAKRLVDLTPLLGSLVVSSRDFH